MILSIAALKDPGKLGQVKDALAGLTWQDGRSTAGASARQVKRNEQAVLNDPRGTALRELLTPIIAENPIVKAAARPRRISSPMVSKTEDGGHYGAHVDNAIMGSGAGRIRTDISFTLFLTEPDQYEGGELVIHHAGMTQSIKGKPGDLVLYPSTSIHEVKPVTSGTRIVCVGWIESVIRNVEQRELLFDLENTRASLRKNLPAGSAELLTLDKTISNLIRMWS